MSKSEIPRERWEDFFDVFSVNHEGWIASVEVLGPTLGAQETTSGLPLVGITADLKGGASRIEIAVGDTLEAHATHIIGSPNRVRVMEDGQEGHEAVEIESEDGTTTLLRFHHVDRADHQLSAEGASRDA